MKLLALKNRSGKAQKHLAQAILLVGIAGVASLFAFTGINNKNESQKPERLTLSLIKDTSFRSATKRAPLEEKEMILIEASKILRTEIHSVTDGKHKDFVPDDFKNVYPIIDFMLAVDSVNGHAIYFKGEVYRLLNNNDRFVEYFQRYLNLESTAKPQLQKVTNARLCYETPHGYCEKRTAWISQLLANYYYQNGLREPEESKKMEAFSIATRHIQNVRIHFPAGFSSSSVTLSTVELEKNLKANIGKLSAVKSQAN
ncbi:hypothetical protein [uncultured Acetobacteroides sp.]|uniref:hypothetical protein n=1 Tax=uncultured Acetobacteroides sp. TaxID=1760811 RepID=UPI0037478789